MKGKYERLGTGPIVVWERLMETKRSLPDAIACNWARESGETTIPQRQFQDQRLLKIRNVFRELYFNRRALRRWQTLFGSNVVVVSHRVRLD